jgi:hypothetical protein
MQKKKIKSWVIEKKRVIKNFIKSCKLWLVNKINSIRRWGLKLLHQILFGFQDFDDFTKSSKSWFLYIILITISFILCNNKLQTTLSEFIDINIYNTLKVDFKLACNLIDSSIGIIATIFSIGFIIIGFLISNLKSHQEDTYDLIYKNIRLFPTLYLSLTIIGTLVIISLLRDSLKLSTFINMVIWGTFLIIVTLFLIGRLFIKIIEHIKPKNVYHYYFLEIRKIAKRVHHNFKIKKNRIKMNEMKVSLDERLSSASSKGEIENLNYILSIFEEITKLKS